MNYHAVGDKVIFNPALIRKYDSAISDNVILKVLEKLGFLFCHDPISTMHYLTTFCASGSRYKLGASPDTAPKIVDCSSFTQWLYSKIGIELPRLAIQQYQFGENVPISEAVAGDLIFTAGKGKNFIDDPNKRIGHVGIILETTLGNDTGKVAHAVEGRGVIFTTLRELVNQEDFRGIKGILPKAKKWLTLRIPERFLSRIETTDDVVWLVLTKYQSML